MDRSSSAAVVRCAGDLGLRTCEATYAALLKALAADEEVIIDCTDASEADASFLQLLLAARASAHARGRSLRLATPAGGALLDVLVRGGFLDPAQPTASAEAAFWSAGAGPA